MIANQVIQVDDAVINLDHNIEPQLENIAQALYMHVKSSVVNTATARHLGEDKVNQIIIEFQVAWKACLEGVLQKQPSSINCRKSRVLHATIKDILWYLEHFDRNKYSNWINSNTSLIEIESRSKHDLISYLYKHAHQLFYENSELITAIHTLGEVKLYERLVVHDLFSKVILEENLQSQIPKDYITPLTKLIYGRLRSCDKVSYTETLTQKSARSVIAKHAQSGRQKVLEGVLLPSSDSRSEEIAIHSLIFLDLAYGGNMKQIGMALKQINCSKTLKSAIMSPGNRKALHAWNRINECLFRLHINTAPVPQDTFCTHVRDGLFWFQSKL